MPPAKKVQPAKKQAVQPAQPVYTPPASPDAHTYTASVKVPDYEGLARAAAAVVSAVPNTEGTDYVTRPVAFDSTFLNSTEYNPQALGGELYDPTMDVDELVYKAKELMGTLSSTLNRVKKGKDKKDDYYGSFPADVREIVENVGKNIPKITVKLKLIII